MTKTLSEETEMIAGVAGAPAQTIVWFELPAQDLDRAIGFYETVFKTKLVLTTENTPNPYATFPTADGMGTSGHIYPGTPAKDGSGPTVHLLVPDALEPTMERVKAAGGALTDIPIITIPPGRFAYATDIDGNSIGLFEAKAA